MGTEKSSGDSIFSQQVRELVAIGAAIGVNCEPCFIFHYDKARKLGLSKEDMFKAVETAKMVKEAAASSVLDLANNYLNLGSEKEPTCNRKGACCSGKTE
jgi:AhpD family alkylhydroperoxidase